MVAKKKIKPDKKNLSLFLGFLMLFSVLAFVITNNLTGNSSTNNGGDQPEIYFVTNWKGLPVYAQDTGIGTQIYYMQVADNFYMSFRANPAEAEAVPSPPAFELYSALMTSSKVYLLYDEENNDAVRLGAVEMGRFLANRPFELEVGLTEPYMGNETQAVMYHDPWNVTEPEMAVYLTVGDNISIRLVERTIVIEAPDMMNMTIPVTKLGLILGRFIT
ncbi:MAG TPA: hypothetical protein ENN60_00670 [archaeon]|nr:hypothetical protein [archaeon]